MILAMAAVQDSLALKANFDLCSDYLSIFVVQSNSQGRSVAAIEFTRTKRPVEGRGLNNMGARDGTRGRGFHANRNGNSYSSRGGHSNRY